MDSKKDNSMGGLVTKIVAAAFGAVALFMIFVPNVFILGLKSGEWSAGLNVAFGIAAKDSQRYFLASAAIVPYVLTLAGVALAVVGCLGKGGKIVPIIAAVLFCGAAVTFLICNYLVVINPDIAEYIYETRSDVINIFSANEYTVRSSDDVYAIMQENITLGAGALIGGTFCCVSCLTSLASVFLPKKG